jgi:hypothetical protein
MAQCLVKNKGNFTSAIDEYGARLGTGSLRDTKLIFPEHNNESQWRAEWGVVQVSDVDSGTTYTKRSVDGQVNMYVGELVGM